MKVELIARPLDSVWPGEETRDRRRSTFRASWTQTVAMLRDEASKLGCHRVVMQCDLRDSQLRVDGWIKARCQPESPRIIISMETRHGPMRYPCDRFDNWQDNVRAVALALKALRQIDRYGVSGRGEQYAGWNALPPAGHQSSAMQMPGMTTAVRPSMSVEAAARVIVDACGTWWGEGESPDLLVDVRSLYESAVREAARRHHPDRAGTGDTFARVTEAKSVLDKHHRRR